MKEQPEALRLAAVPIFERSITWQSQATIELRRLHAELVESEKWRSRDEARAANAERERDIAEAQRDALLEVARAVDAHYSASLDHKPAYVALARAAIKTVEGEGA